MPIVWRDSMAVGHPVIDHEHKYLICLINSVELALKVENRGQVLEFYLEQLVDYTREHFLHEERIQLKMKYPHYAAHKVEHQEILEALEDLKAKLISAPPKPAKEPVDLDTLGTEEIEDYDPSASPEPAAASTPSSIDADETTVNEVVKFLRHWIIDHVLKSDIKMREYFQRLQPK